MAVQNIKVSKGEVTCMATNGSEDGGASDRDKCRAVTEIALQEAARKCGGDEAVKEQLRMMLGFTGEEPDPDCEASLEEGLNEETLKSPRGLNQWVFCRAWQKFRDGEPDNLGDALESSWADARTRAAEMGLEI
jgi:hypothetical protein